MCRGWKGLALVAAYWCLIVPAQAQVGGTYPSQVGAARMPEPIPYGPSTTPPPPQPNLIPGPISPQAAPMGPPDALSLPYDHTGAFQTENYVQEGGFFAAIGPMALQRNHLGAGDIAVVNAQAVGLGNGPTLADPFNPAPTGAASALNFNSVKPALSLGIRGNVGYLWGNNSVELLAFYIWQDNVTATANQPFSLDTLFYNPPLGLVGGGLFRRSDSAMLTQGSSLFNAEANYRRWNSGFAGLDFIVGARYVRQNDYLSILTSGTNLLGTPYGQTPTTSSMLYQVLTHNNLEIGQIGAEYNLNIARWLTLAGMGKAGWGVNYATTNVSMNGNGSLPGFSLGGKSFNTDRHDTVFAQVYMLGAFADINIMERMRLRLGYTATWLIGVATAVDQVNFNLQGAQARDAFGVGNFIKDLKSGNASALSNVQNTIQHGNFNTNGSILYFGPQIELQFFF